MKKTMELDSTKTNENKEKEIKLGEDGTRKMTRKRGGRSQWGKKCITDSYVCIEGGGGQITSPKPKNHLV